MGRRRPSYFVKYFKKHTQQSATDFLRNGFPNISFLLGPSALGINKKVKNANFYKMKFYQLLRQGQ